MSANLPLDANDEDIQQRGLRRPSLDTPLLPLRETFQAVRSSYDNAAPGLPSTDNIWPQRLPEEMAALDPVQRRQFLEQRGLVPPEGSTPANVSLPGVDSLVESVTQIDNSAINNVLENAGTFTDKLTNINQQIDQALSNAGQASVPIDSYGQPLVGNTTQPLPLTTSPPGGQYSPPGTQPNTGGGGPAYQYSPVELYNDRYDFNTGKTIRTGIATGSKGGIGSGDNPGNTVSSPGPSNQQLSSPPPPPNLSPNDTSTEQYDDAILREARQEENAPQGTATSRLDGKDGDLYSPKPEGRLSNRLDSKGQTPPPPPPPNLSNRLDTKGSHRASRNEIIASRRQSGSDIKFARANGETLVRHRRPDGTYYAGPPKNVSNKQLPQRYKDF